MNVTRTDQQHSNVIANLANVNVILELAVTNAINATEDTWVVHLTVIHVASVSTIGI